MTTPLFSTYSQGENRVTATFIAVLQRLSIPSMSRILGALLDEQNFSVANFVNQPQGVESTPDAKIETGHSVWVETKIASNAVKLSQMRRHMKAVGDDEKLIALTPDDEEPAVLRNRNLAQKDKDRIVWANFNTLDNIVTEILDDKESPPSEFEASLLREFSSFLQREGLISIPSEERVMVVSAGYAWSRYNDKSVYGDIRIPNWKPSDHLAFYTEMEIKRVVPRIKSTVSPINIRNKEEVEEKLDDHQKQVVGNLIKNPFNEETFDASLRMLFLSEPGDKETIKLEKPIVNDKKTSTGKSWAYVMKGAKYVTLESLKNARYTSELKPC